ncbi:hypothetical protein CXG81DRAFT_19501 [Caulochytrium protostelioides]|uniref:Uncharacterized protein n=1 Tax=Caulochytrium protostelioides TaxID=1555241 RepID=A0A4P9X5W6_9FUNG|nr:hypothetical protein CXG81DRAFT_19501 [Caulochytrium protostelioides]|eukprot:RKP00545.1 hypothetical protein CXG81DRAFT_19501 [Caulochytrium protostelioides]
MKEAAVPEPKYRNWPYLKRLFNWHAPFWKTLVSLLSQDTSAGPPAWPSKYKNVQQSLTVGLLYPINGYVDFGIASSELVNWKPALYTYLYLALNHRLVFKESPDYDARARLPGLLAIYQPPVDPRLKSPPRPSYEYHLGELARNFEIFRGEDAGLPMALELHAGLLVTRELSHGAFGDLFLKARAACSQSVISEESMQHLVALRVILWEKHRKARAPVENPPQDVDDFERESGEFDSPISDRDPASPDVEWLAPGGLSAPETGRVLPMLHDGSS